MVQLGLGNYFILKRYRFLTTTIFIGSASTIHKSFKIMFKIVLFGVIQAYASCLLVLRIPFLE